MECLYCQQELTCEDFYGKNLRLDNLGKIKEGFIKTGDIYRCQNEECDYFDEHFYTDSQGNLHEGYPC